MAKLGRKKLQGRRWHTGFSSLLSARKGEAEDAHRAGLEKDREAEGRRQQLSSKLQEK